MCLRLRPWTGWPEPDLATDRLDECEDALGALAKVAASDATVNAAFAGRWTAITRDKLLLRRERFDEAIQQIDIDLFTPLRSRTDY